MKHTDKTICVRCIMPDILHMLPHFILTTNLSHRCHYAYVISEETEFCKNITQKNTSKNLKRAFMLSSQVCMCLCLFSYDKIYYLLIAYHLPCHVPCCSWNSIFPFQVICPYKFLILIHFHQIIFLSLIGLWSDVTLFPSFPKTKCCWSDSWTTSKAE